jgi:hypothetical protein
MLGPGARGLVAPDPGQLFDFDRAKARVDILDPDRALWPVNAYSDADELNALFEAAIESGVISRCHGDPRIHVYPLSLSEPEPVLAVAPPSGPALLGHALTLREREGESPLAFTLRLLDEVTEEANALAASQARS